MLRVQRRHSPLVAVLLAALTAAAVPACGGTSESPSAADSEQEQVTSVIEKYQQALKDKDGEALCDLAYLDSAAGTEGRDGPLKGEARTDCVREVESADQPPPSFDLKVRSVQVEGDTARAKVQPPESAPKGAGGNPDFRLRRFGGDWKVALAPN